MPDWQGIHSIHLIDSGHAVSPLQMRKLSSRQVHGLTTGCEPGPVLPKHWAVVSDLSLELFGISV